MTKVQERFDNEAKFWKDIYSKLDDIISLEAYQRKEYAKSKIDEVYDNKKIKILDIGCGAGKVIHDVTLSKTREGKGVDISIEMVKTCQEKYKKHKNISFSQLNIDNNKLNEKFDVILMMGVYGYFKNNKIVLKNINSMLNKDGHLIFTIGNKTSIFRQVNILIDFMVKNCLMSSILDVYRKFILKRTDKLKINHFKSSNLKKTKDLLDKSGFEFIEKKNLVFSSGVLGKRSVKISNFYSKFKIFEYLNQGFSMIITAKKK